MTRIITRSYDSYETAAAVVENLEAAGISSSDISVIGHDERTKESNAAEGAGIGAGVGGAAGLLAGLGMLAIPGIGPVVAAGWLASTAAGAVAGAAAGGLVGSFTSAGVDEGEAHYHAETVRRGGTVVSVKAPDAHAAEVEAIMDGATPIDRDTRTAEYRREGWTRFDERADPYKVPLV
ncbi:MAG TPA: general stress protein [Bosea sp. (in: a-proteobacteria)]|jgi:uncharacterized membrane protein|uniref:general stress protein n=1 Tax=Bosea sp. (in: a-proteobacteria) TaxID=1871050 RepID=UPI002E11A744|nr:general stress protein [Bosea sp. (in: a-proteobacteria)]